MLNTLGAEFDSNLLDIPRSELIESREFNFEKCMTASDPRISFDEMAQSALNHATTRDYLYTRLLVGRIVQVLDEI